LPTIKIGGRPLVGRFLFGLLVLFSAAVGAAAGLLLVYSTDLPQVEELERYRPSSVTELYDGKGRVIGTFALQRRVIAAYTLNNPYFIRIEPALTITEEQLNRGLDALAESVEQTKAILASL